MSLLKYGADPGKRNAAGKEAIHYAAITPDACIQELADAGCDVNCRDDVNRDTPLHVACSRCCVENIVKLIQNGAKINALNNHNETPLTHLLKYVSVIQTFHSFSWINICLNLMKIGFKMPYSATGNSIKENKYVKCHRNGVQELYNRHLLHENRILKLQNICRLCVRDNIPGVRFNNQIETLDISEPLKEYLCFKNNFE